VKRAKAGTGTDTTAPAWGQSPTGPRFSHSGFRPSGFPAFLASGFGLLPPADLLSAGLPVRRSAGQFVCRSAGPIEPIESNMVDRLKFENLRGAATFPSPIRNSKPATRNSHFAVRPSASKDEG